MQSCGRCAGALLPRLDYGLLELGANSDIDPACDHCSQMRRKPEELRGISEEVLYELQMLFWNRASPLRDDIQGTGTRGDVVAAEDGLYRVGRFARART